MCETGLSSRGEREVLKIRYLLMNAYSVGGTIRTVINQANAFAGEHEVEIVSVFRWREEPAFDIDPRIRLVPLLDRRKTRAPRSLAIRAGRRVRPRAVRRLLPNSWLDQLPSTRIHRDDGKYANFSELSDRRILSYLRALRGGILVSTRPSLNLLVAMFAPPSVVRIGQDHMNLKSYKKGLRRQITKWYGRLNAVVVLTEADERDYRDALAGSDVHIERIPNPLPATAQAAPLARLDKPVVIAAGRLTPQKGFDRLIDAFVDVAAARPDSQLRIFGSGVHRDKLRQQIQDRQLDNHAFLRGHSGRLDDEMAKASIFVLSSRFEGFPMVVLEAMRQGLPVVAFDCHTGPAEMITHGHDGLLIPDGDLAGLAEAIVRLLNYDVCRRAMGANAARSVQQFAMNKVASQWEQLFTDLTASTKD
jgi:glycosyltransferase involved in cell wall biosynthesis